MTNNTHEEAGARISVLSQRTANLEQAFGDVRREFNAQISGVNSAVANIATKLDERFNTLSTAMSERNKPQWQAIGVALTFCALLGGLAYWPIRESTTDLKEAVKALAVNTVTREEMDWRTARSAEDRARQDGAIADLRTNAVSRNEWTERNRARDQEVLDLNRRVDEIRQDVGAVYGTRDVIQDMKKEIDRLRQRQVDMRSGVPPGS